MGMAQRRQWTSWFRLWGAKRPARNKLDDFADYGTAFGLDLSLAASEAQTPPPVAARASNAGQLLEQPPYGANA